jgi:YfiH family protein
VAGFSTRAGGDDPGALARAAGFPLGRLYMVTQVHGSRVVEVRGDEDPAAVRTEPADALVTRAPGVALAVRTADCVPVLLSCVAGPGGAPVVAAVHGGWRGIVAGVIPAAVARVAALAGAPASSLRAAIGPAIGPCCFEVDETVATTLAAAVGRPEVVVDRGATARPHVDLGRAARWALLGAGVAPEHVEAVGPCTRCAASLLHSYRRDGSRQGRQLSFVWLPR